MVLVDTSVWIDHFRRGNKRLETLLLNSQVLTHSAVLGELACGNLSPRKRVLEWLNDLPKATEAMSVEVLHLIEAHRLYGKGLGYIDLHLLAATQISKVKLWTLDQTLESEAKKLQISSTFQSKIGHTLENDGK